MYVNENRILYSFTAKGCAKFGSLFFIDLLCYAHYNVFGIRQILIYNINQLNV